MEKTAHFGTKSALLYVKIYMLLRGYFRRFDQSDHSALAWTACPRPCPPAQHRDTPSAPAPSRGRAAQRERGTAAARRQTETAPPGERPAPRPSPATPARSPPATPSAQQQPQRHRLQISRPQPSQPRPAQTSPPASRCPSSRPARCLPAEAQQKPQQREREGDGQDLRHFARPLAVKVIYTTNRPPQRLPARLDTMPTGSPIPGHSRPSPMLARILLLESLQN